jgi:U5 small nuclear ribonucleoprotein component
MENIYTGDMTGIYADAMRKCDPSGPLMVQVVKLYNSVDMESFEVFGRVMSGTITVGQKIRVLGEGYTPEDEEDMTLKYVEALSIYESR